jgi:serine/threonine protein kinase
MSRRRSNNTGEFEERDTQCDEPSPFIQTDRPPAPESPPAAPEPMKRSKMRARMDTVPEEEGEGDDLELVRAPKPGEIIDGRYELVRVLGRGATGVVYEARHRLMGNRLAIKCLHREMASDNVAVERLIREARIAASAQHPNVVSVMDAGRDGDLYYITMELLEGESLTAFLARGPHDMRLIVGYFISLLDGVAKVHQMGVVHRDIKPDNVYLAKNELGDIVPKVLDFGVSKLRDGGAGKALTAVGMSMGTPYYMAPEQFKDTRNVDVRADVYSLGVMLYEALAGVVPYPGESILEVFNAVTEGRPEPLRARSPQVPPALEELVARALCGDKEARWPDVKSMREALAAVVFDGTYGGSGDPWLLGRTDPSAALPAAPPSDSTLKTTQVMQASDFVAAKVVPATNAEQPQRALPAAPADDKQKKLVLLAIAAAAVFLFGAFALGAVALWLLFGR